MEDAKQAFSNLTDAQKALVPNLSKTKLEAAIEKIAQLELDNSAASNVESQINELPAVNEVELTNKLEIESAIGNYNSLTEAQKELVDEEFVTKLTELEEIIIQLETEAEEVKKQINSLPSPEAIELTQKETVQTVREAYNALDEAQKELVGAESIEKLVAVENAIIALEEAQEIKPTIESTLPSQITASKEYEFEVSTTQGNVPDNTMVWVELELENPEQQGAIQMQYHEIRDGKYYPLAFNEGKVKYGPEGGFPFQDTSSKLKVSFSKSGTYEYTVRVMSSNGAIVEEKYTIVVVETDPTITSTLPTEVTASKEYEFEVSTTKGSEPNNTMVWVELELENPEQQDAIQMQYHETQDGKYYPLPFNEEGLVKYGPAGGFPLQDATSKFKVMFSEAGTYEYTVRIVSESGKIVEETYTVEVAEAEVKPTITSSLPIEVIASNEYDFEVSTTKGSVPDNTMVWVELELENPEQQGAIQMQYHEIRDGKYYSLPFNEDGLVKYGPAGGFPLQDATSKFKVKFSKAGTYEYTVRIVSESGMIVEETYTVEVAEIKPTITSSLPIEVTASNEYDFEVSTTKGSEPDNTMVWVELVLANPEQQDAIQMQYHETRDEQYYSLPFNEGKVKYGPEGGFPLQDATSKFKVSFSNSGTYEYIVRIVSGTGVLVQETYQVEVIKHETESTETGEASDSQI